METKKKALGKGLEQLFSNNVIDFENFEDTVVEENKKDVTEINIDEIRSNPYQPRKTFNEESLNELAESIKEHGVFQPIIVKKSIKGYEIVAGERRFRASKLAGKETIPAIVRNFTDEEMMEIAVLENLQRENLNAVDEANAYKTLMENLHLTQDQVSKRVNKSRSHITNLLGILALPEDVLTLVKENKLTMGHARCLSKLSDIEKINELTKKVLEENLSVRELEALASGEEIERKNKIVKKPKSNEYTSLEKELTEYYGTKVKIANKKLIISFENNQDLNRILEMINYNK